MKVITLNRFDGGIVNDPRIKRSNVSRVTSNFNVLTDYHRAIPKFGVEDGHSAQTTDQVQNFAIALRTGTTYSLYGLGVVSGTARAEVSYKNLTTGSANDLDDNGWTETANNASSTGSTSFNLFVYYARTGLIYGARAGTHIWAYDPSGSAAWADSHQALTYTSIAQGLVHSKDDILYIPYDNKIARNNNGSWTTAALTLPTHLVINSICEYGNYLAIACSDKSGFGKAQVFLWDRDSSLTTLSESISWGDEELKIIEEIEGELVGISLAGNTTPYQEDRIIFRKYFAGTGAIKFLELKLDSSSNTTLPIAKQKVDGRLFFMLQAKINGSQREGVWSIGRTPATREWALIHEQTLNNDTAAVTAVLYNFILVGDFLFQSFNDNAVYKMTKTIESGTYGATSIIETVINPGMDPGEMYLNKQLVSVGLITEPLPASATATVKFKVDGASSYTTVMSRTTDSEIAFETTVFSDGTEFTSGREFEFRIESTLGAVITGLVYKYEVLETLIS